MSTRPSRRSPERKVIELDLANWKHLVLLMLTGLGAYKGAEIIHTQFNNNPDPNAGNNTLILDEAPQPPINLNIEINFPPTPTFAPTAEPETEVTEEVTAEETQEVTEEAQPVIELTTPAPIATETPTPLPTATESPTPTPDPEPTPEPFPDQDPDNDASPGLAGINNEESLRTADSQANYFNRTLATLEMNPDQRDIILGNQKWYDMVTSPLVVGRNRLNLRTPQDGGLGWGPEVWNSFPQMQTTFESIFGSSWGQPQLIIESLDTVSGVAQSFPERNLTVTANTVEGFDQVFESTYVQVRAIMSHHPRVSLWPADRQEAVAVQIANQLIFERIEGSVYWGQRPMLKLVNGQVQSFAQVSSGEGGFVACRVQGEPNEPDITEQNLTTQRVRIVYPEGRTSQQMPFDRNARNELYMTEITIRTSDLLALSEDGFIDGFMGIVAFEIFDLGTLHNSPQTNRPNFIPAGWEVGGDTSEETQIDPGDLVYPFRPCGESTPVFVPTIAAPSEVPYVPPQGTPPVEETPPITPTPPTTTPEPEKSGPGNQTNPDGETEPDPTGGQVIIDGQIDTDGDGVGDTPDNIGSGR